MDATKPYSRIVSCIIYILVIGLTLVQGCSSSDDPPNNNKNGKSNTPADTYFSLAVTENSHNHVGAKLLFLDFQEDMANVAVIRNNVVDLLNACGIEHGAQFASLLRVHGLNYRRLLGAGYEVRVVAGPVRKRYQFIK